MFVLELPEFSAFDLALEDPTCLPPCAGFWENLLSGIDDVGKTL